MKKPVRIFLAVLVAFTNSCGDDDNSAPLPAMTEIAKGELVNAYDFPQRDLIISNQDDWDELIITLNQFIDISDSIIDFNKFTVVAVFDALKGSQGYSVEIIEVIEENLRVAVNVLHLSPESESNPTITQAFHIIKIPKSEKSIEFEHNAVPPFLYPTLLLKGNLSGSGSENIPPQNIVVDAENVWQDLLNKINSYYQIPEFPNEYPHLNVNFDQYTVLAVFDQSYGSCCGTIDITDVLENDQGVTVVVRKLLSGALARSSQPFHIVKIPKSSTPVVFIHQ